MAAPKHKMTWRHWRWAARLFGEIANRTSQAAGRAITFLIAEGVVLLWALTGPLFNYSDTWQLVINTGTTIVTFLMVFLIQNSQNRDSAAIQVKLDELIRVSTAQNSFVGIEHLTDDELEEIRTKCERRAEAEKAGEQSVQRTGKKAKLAADRVTAAMTARSRARFDHGTVTKNIESILTLEENDERHLSPLHRVSHQVGWFVGTIYFVIIQAVFVVLWLLWNIFTARSFDPYPFPLLSAVLALEAVFLTSFVLIRQNLMDRRSERRNHLDLQINLLAEKEATSILKAFSEIATHLGIDLSTDAENRELAQDTPVESIARDLRSKEMEISPKR